MSNLAKALNPPFYAAIMNEDSNTKSFDHELTPVDEMVSLAPRQSGFLGLETTRDKNGNCLTISYWADLKSEKAWEHIGDNEIRKQFKGTALKDACPIRVSKINHKIGSNDDLRAKQKAIPESSVVTSSLGAILLSAFPAVAGLLGHEALQ